ncbi:glycosyltransferase [Phenylobacterium sp.]|uniref:glycosyltransferase n=1 Tax=Phenylobacterium sp. TaxID=1871053 RepID=UPI00272508B2|nr:glycosyltransferase [Phenylobacterium sp.]MDO8802280.1 glycosyltransferase [Phenylobacterium sp.]
MTTPAILFEPDGYVVTGPRIMGRQSAGNGFLRAAVQGRAGQQVWGYTARRPSAEAFGRLVREMDSAAQPGWVVPHQFDRMRELGLLYTPGPGLEVAGQLRLRAGIDAYSICGLTHTIASDRAMAEITGLLTAPVAPWDALICTSAVARETIDQVLEAQADYLAWRLQAPIRQVSPMLPVIPLGVHCADFDTTPQDRSQTRADLGLAMDEIAVLFAGRLSPAGKAHPFAMWRGLQACAERTGKKIAFVQAGQFFNPETEAMYRQSAAWICPDVRQVFVDGQDSAVYRSVWGAADIFLSLADSVQETFGLTPVEAMAAGLPAVVSDWDGYKDTVRDGLDGFRIPTWSPGPGEAGAEMARDYETDATTYDFYMSRLSTTVSVDLQVLTDRLCELVANPDLRRRLGESGQRRAREVFDWRVVYGQYEALWAEQTALRQAHVPDGPAPKASPSRPDPFSSFATYPTHHITQATRVAPGPDPGVGWHDRLASGLFGLWRTPQALLAAILAQVDQGETDVGDLARATRCEPSLMIVIVGRLAKMGLLRLSQPTSPPAG